MRRLCQVTLGCALLVTAASYAVTPPIEPSSAEELFKQLSEMPGLEASFVEEKHLALLALPLKSEGKLYFTKRGYLNRSISKPSPSELVITPSGMKLGGRAVDLGGRKSAESLIKSLQWILSGDGGHLNEAFSLSFSKPPAGGWSLVMTPRDAELQQLVASITLTGHGFEVQKIEVQEAMGDRTITTITGADPRRVFRPEECSKLFGAPEC